MEEIRQNEGQQTVKETRTQGGNQQTVIIQQPVSKSNGIGTAGFVLALIAFVLCWVPVLDWILWLLGVIFSLIGVFRRPRGLAIAGLCISFIGLIMIIAVIGAIGVIAASF